MHRFLFLLVCLLLLSCSSEKQTDVTKQEPAETAGGGAPETSRTSGSYSLEIVPADASRNSTLYLNVRGFNIQDAKIEWLVNGNPVANAAPNQFRATETKKGDMIQARAVIQGKEIVSNIVQVKNAPPEISQAKILSEAGDILHVDVSGNDIDGDTVTFTYEWTRNGEPAGNAERLEGPFKKGDRISVKITPYDGESYGRAFILQRGIANMPPRIIEEKPFKYNFDGKVYSYQVKAIDPDGDQLTYSIRSGPPGMNINSTGLVQWNVPPDFKGKASFTVSVSDGNGGETTQNLSVEIKP